MEVSFRTGAGLMFGVLAQCEARATVNERAALGADSGLRSDQIESELRSYRVGIALRRLAEDLAQARRRVVVLERENRELMAQLERSREREPEAGPGRRATTVSKPGRS